MRKVLGMGEVAMIKKSLMTLGGLVILSVAFFIIASPWIDPPKQKANVVEQGLFVAVSD